MALQNFLLELLEDPVDHGTLLYVDELNVLYNPRRRVVYEVRDSIPVLLPDESRPASDAEHQNLLAHPSARYTGSGSTPA